MKYTVTALSTPTTSRQLREDGVVIGHIYVDKVDLVLSALNGIHKTTLDKITETLDLVKASGENYPYFAFFEDLSYGIYDDKNEAVDNLISLPLDRLEEYCDKVKERFHKKTSLSFKGTDVEKIKRFCIQNDIPYEY